MPISLSLDIDALRASLLRAYPDMARTIEAHIGTAQRGGWQWDAQAGALVWCEDVVSFVVAGTRKI